MGKDKFKYGFLVFLVAMNVYWTYFRPSDTYLSHTILDSKYTQRSLLNRVVVINAVILICLVAEFWYLCDHPMRGQEYAIYISLVGMASANRCLVFALHPINVHYLNRIATFTYIFTAVPIFLSMVIYYSRRGATQQRQVEQN